MDLEGSANIAEQTSIKQQLVELIGLENYAKIVKAFGGTYIYIQKGDSDARTERNEKIRSRFNGHNYDRLALEFGLTSVMIRMIVADVDKEMRTGQIDGQEPMAGFEN